ncbi:hypothetical protein Cni_G10884 [Canna indica]|uniref:Uncharacterized protein n=1 Tax=Canna indica TaxID=4628 RepID=A0AAQ3K6T8_9LILI|nr:hypothetical protein Cni_G10884 [Canna indica]
MDGHPRPIRRLPYPLHSPPPLPFSTALGLLRGRRRPRFRRQGRRHLHLLGAHRFRGQLDVLLWPPLPSRLDLLSHLLHPVGLQRRLRLLPQRAKVHPPHPQLRRAADLLGGAPRGAVRLRGRLRRRAQGEVSAGFRADGRRVGDVLAHPLADAAHVPEGAEEGDLRGGAADANMHVAGCGDGLGGGAVRQRRGGDAEGGDEGVREGEGLVRDDAGVDGGGVAGGLCGGGRIGVRGVVAVLQRGEHVGAAAGADICGHFLP